MNDIPISNLSFKFMGLFFKFRDLMMSPTKFLEHTGISPGWNVLDYEVPYGELLNSSCTTCWTNGKSLCC
jgi:hypothetical protein